MPSVFQQAREAGQKAVMSGGDYLEKDELVRSAAVFGIGTIRWEESGGYQGGSRWVLPVEPWYDEDDEPSGLLTFGGTSFRDEYFGKLMDAQEELPEGELLGPCILVKAKAQKGPNFFDILEWDEEGQRPVIQEGQKVIGWNAQEPPLVQASRGDRARPSRPSRPAVNGRAASASSAEPRREAASSSTPASSTAEEAPHSSPPAPTGRRARPSPGSAPGPAAAAEPTSAPTSTTTGTPRRGRPPGSRNRPQAAETPPAAPRAPEGTEPPPGGAQAAQEVVFTPGELGKATCPHCNLEIEGRVYPDPSGQPMMIHPCTTAKDNVVLLASVGGE